MTSARSKTSTGLAILVLATAALVAGCQMRPTGQNGYQLIGVDAVTNSQTGVRKEIKHWRHDNGAVTDSSKVVFNPQAGRSPRGTKPSR